METSWLLILWFIATSSGSPAYEGNIYNIGFEDDASCQQALTAIRKKSKEKIDGVCVSTKSSAPKIIRR